VYAYVKRGLKYPMFEVHDHLGAGDRQTLARPDVERHARPTPVVDLNPHRDVGLGTRALGHALLVQVGRDLLPADPARSVLAAHHVVGDVLRVVSAAGAQELHLLVAEAVRRSAVAYAGGGGLTELLVGRPLPLAPSFAVVAIGAIVGIASAWFAVREAR
jgi:hypothetical protein